MGKTGIDAGMSPGERRAAVAELLVRGVRRWKRFCLEPVSETSDNSSDKRLEPRAESRLSVSQAISDRSTSTSDRSPTYAEETKHV